MASGTYASFTLADALSDMGSRLFDPLHVRWPEAELTIYIQQAIRTYNAFTNHFRDDATFTTTNKQAFYDLDTVAPALRAMTYTVKNAVNEILYHLLEPPLQGLLWTGTQQYSLDDVLSALQQARDTFLLETGLVVSRSTQAVGASASGVVDLDETIIAVRRAAWTVTGITAPLRRTDQWGLVNYRVGWQTQRSASPLVYSVSAQPPLQLQIAPPTSTAGTLDLLTVNRGDDPDLLDATQVLGVPDDWAWVVIFGALAQLFQRDGLAVDPYRAAYCDARWQDGLARAKTAAVVLAAYVNGTWTPLGSVPDADAYSADWQTVSGVPKRVLTMGHTIVGLWPPAGVPPAGGSYSVTLDVVRNAPVPSALGDYLQVGNEVLNDLLDYAQHLALLKEGPQQIQTAMGLLEQFSALCGTTIKVQMANAPNDPVAIQQTTQDGRMQPYQSV